MLRQIGKRLATAIPSLIGVIIVTFLLTRVLPGDPAAYFAGPAASPQAIEEIRKSLGLDKSLAGTICALCAGSQPRRFRKVADHGPDRDQGHHHASAGFRRADLAWPDRFHADRGAVRHYRGGQARLDHRSCLPRDCDRRRLAAGLLHRIAAGLCVLFYSGLVAGAARAARCVLLGAQTRHRLLSDRQPDRRQSRNLPCRLGAACCFPPSRLRSSRSRRSRA